MHEMKTIQLFSLLLIISSEAYCQSPYSLSWKKESIIYASAFSVLGLDYIAEKKLQPFTEAEIETKTASEINRFDRLATKLNSEKANRISDITAYSAVSLGMLVPLAIPVMHSRENQYIREVFVLGNLFAECNAAARAGTEITKLLAKRSRPYVYNSDFPMEMRTGTDARQSFFSGHTSATAVNTYFLAKVYSDYFPESKIKPFVWVAAATIPAWTALKRVQAGKHFPTDVITGYVYGAACGFLIPHFHKKENAEKVSTLKVHPYFNYEASGVSASLQL